MTTPGWYARGPQGEPGPPGQGIELAGTVNAYADLPGGLGVEDNGAAYLVNADGRLYVWSGTAFPADGDGIEFRGEQGEQGPQGEPGPEGEQGIQGPKGDTGDPGPKGDQGDPGPKGDKGDQGDPGADGADGADGDLTEAGLVTLVENAASAIREALDALYEDGGGPAGVWGEITGTLTEQLDLIAALDDKADSTHTHTASQVSDSTTVGRAVLTAANAAAARTAIGAGTASTKADVGLGNVSNTSDANKPISTATQAALDDKADVADALTETSLTSLVVDPGSDIRDALDTLYEGGGGGGTWGSITGTLADQTDLQAVLDVLTTGRVSAYVDGTLTDREIDVMSETQWGSTTPVSGRVYMVFED